MTATPKAERDRKSSSVSTGGAGDATLEAAYSRAKTRSEELQRGAGSGEYAVATRARAYNEEPVEAPIEVTEYPEGDIDKGRLDPEAGLPQGGQLIAHRDRRAYLIRQAELNEAANDELNFIQTEQNKRLGIVSTLLQDPDVQRETSMVNAVASLAMHDPEEFRKSRDERKLMRHNKHRERMGLPPDDALAKGNTNAANSANSKQPKAENVSDKQ